MTGQAPAARDEVLKFWVDLLETETAAILRPTTSNRSATIPLGLLTLSIMRRGGGAVKNMDLWLTKKIKNG